MVFIALLRSRGTQNEVQKASILPQKIMIFKKRRFWNR